MTNGSYCIGFIDHPWSTINSDKPSDKGSLATHRFMALLCWICQSLFGRRGITNLKNVMEIVTENATTCTTVTTCK